MWQTEMPHCFDGIVIVRKDAFHGVPECSRVIGMFDVREFVNDDVAEDGLRQEEKRGIEVDVSFS